MAVYGQRKIFVKGKVRFGTVTTATPEASEQCERKSVTLVTTGVINAAALPSAADRLCGAVDRVTAITAAPEVGLTTLSVSAVGQCGRTRSVSMPPLSLSSSLRSFVATNATTVSKDRTSAVPALSPSVYLSTADSGFATAETSPAPSYIDDTAHVHMSGGAQHPHIRHARTPSTESCAQRSSRFFGTTLSNMSPLEQRLSQRHSAKPVLPSVDATSLVSQSTNSMVDYNDHDLLDLSGLGVCGPCDSAEWAVSPKEDGCEKDGLLARFYRCVVQDPLFKPHTSLAGQAFTTLDAAQTASR
ncbi:hypothetical protein THASP1DRAFT_26778 [Thamnocephalis sphaerospora]|uniref:Uncharacterized protein n=1 Tax=Thamnocephalis sphaerospora TaxID=78915 RepID=A0A4P9XHF4_9FUNG|nr:hypothetical protein THASP1DRAFT_26778 [Thamnocephalis sphaerospora]|eukprot:RKP04630.1 hypothetical protein THASP1DRAFT_26778 [Thamnocephalis sphaerospora]